MKKPHVLVTRRIPEIGLQLLQSACDLEINPNDRPLTRQELLTKAAKADGVLGLLTDRIDAEFFDATPNLRGYANYAVGFDNINVPEATRRKIPVSNTPDVLTLATAELAWGLILATARRIAETDPIMRSGSWNGWGPLQFIGSDVSHKTLGILGAGRIGTATALMSKGFNMRVIYTANRPNPTLDAELNATRVPFEQLLEQSDFISIHTPLTPQTKHLFNSSTFARMKPTAIIVNTARGPVINETDLVTALTTGTIAGAGLDVYESEPHMAPGLANLPNTVLLPHIGSATRSSRDGMAQLAAQNLLAMLNGKRPPTCLNPEIYGG